MRVVGVGASAGGLEALEQLFRAMPEDTGMAFVVVQHLSPTFKSQMDELMPRWTHLTVRVAAHEMPLAPNTVYLLPPNAELIVADGRLLLKERSEGLALPIDQFLRSSARDLGDRAVAIILSGTGSDGSRGVREVHEAGGVVIVQSEESAKFDGMPKSAIETGMVDYIAEPREIPAVLLRHFEQQHGSDGAVVETEPADVVKLGGMRAVFALLHERYGIDFSYYKPGTIGRRTERRLLLNQSDNLADYIERLRNDRGELDALYQDLLIGVTEFFRDTEAFELLELQILPKLISETLSGKELRLWTAGCASGEEAYSLAILVAEALERSGRPLTAKIFATDVHRPSLDVASAGLYSERAVANVAPRRLARFFTRGEHGYRVSAELRRMIVFAPHNVIRDAPFTKLDLVSCRNMLIYLQPTVQRKAMSLFHFGLRTGGVLFLGPSESPGDLGDEFEIIDQHWKLYRKRRDVRLLPGLRSTPMVNLGPSTTTSYGGRPAGSDGPLLEIFSGLLDNALPPSVLLDARHQIVHSFGDISALLRLPRGRPSLSLLDMLEGELKLAVAGALHRAARSRSPVSFHGVHGSNGVGERTLDIRVTPLEVPRMTDPFFLVSLATPTEPVTPLPANQTLDLDAVSRDRLEALELELRHSKENLQATIEELEASNEELQATNEEMLASNEELQSTNEELHSVNEELYTVNSEFQHKIDQLTELTDDMDNLLLSTEVHTLFLDDHLCIRKFTPAMAEVFNLLETDVGRRIDGFVHSIAIGDLDEILTRTRNTGERYEAEVESRSGPFLMRVLPYRGRAERAGVVLTLIDITKLREAEQALREQVTLRDRFLAMLSHELRNPLAAVNNALTLLGRRLPTDQEALRKPLGMIERQSRHMQRLLDDLLDVSRVTQGKIHLRHETFELQQIARDAIEHLQSMINEREQTLTVAFTPQSLWIRGDSARILQVFDNLLSNACKYTPMGGHIGLEIGFEDNRAKITIRDDGAGIDPQTQAQIFDMFVQADTTLDRSQGGLGVGLTLVHNLVELHEGTVSVHSEGVGKGSVFVVLLPCVAAPTVRDSQTRDSVGRRHGPTRLVIVEDRPEIRETLAELLREDGYEVLTAADGKAGLELITQQRPDVGLLDIGLPGIDGYELARRLRANNATANIPLVAMTGYGRSDDRALVTEAGFDEHLVKPVDIDQVIGALERLGLAL